MSEQKTRFVVGGVYRRPRIKAVGGFQYGVLLDAVEEPNGRLHGRICVGGELPVPVGATHMENWELIAEPGNPLVKVGPKYVTDEDLQKAVDLAVAGLVRSNHERVTTLEAELIGLRARVKELEAPTASGAPAMSSRARAS